MKGGSQPPSRYPSPPQGGMRGRGPMKMGRGQPPQQYGGALNRMRGQAMQQRQAPRTMAQPQAKPQMAEALRNFRGRML